MRRCISEKRDENVINNSKLISYKILSTYAYIHAIICLLLYVDITRLE